MICWQSHSDDTEYRIRSRRFLLAKMAGIGGACLNCCWQIVHFVRSQETRGHLKSTEGPHLFGTMTPGGKIWLRKQLRYLHGVEKCAIMGLPKYVGVGHSASHSAATPQGDHLIKGSSLSDAAGNAVQFDHVLSQIICDWATAPIKLS